MSTKTHIIPTTPVAFWYFNTAQQLEKEPTWDTKVSIINQLFAPVETLQYKCMHYYWDLNPFQAARVLPAVADMEMDILILFLYMIATIASDEGV